MKSKSGVRFISFVLGLFALSLIATTILLFTISYFGSLSIADREIERFAEKEQVLARLIYEQHLSQLNMQLTAIASNDRFQSFLESRDTSAALTIIEQISTAGTGPSPELLIVDHVEQPEWLNASLLIAEFGLLNSYTNRKALPSEVWKVLTTIEENSPTSVAALSIPVVSNMNGRVLGHIVGGITLNESFLIPGSLSSALDAENLVIYHEQTPIAGIGNIMGEPVIDDLPKLLADKSHILQEDTLFVRSRLATDTFGGSVYVITRHTSDTIENVQKTYAELFGPFAIYILLGCVIAAYMLHQFTSPALEKLMSYTTKLGQGGQIAPYEASGVKEFDKLGSLFHDAFENIRLTDAKFRDLIDGSLQGCVIHSDFEILYINEALLEILGYEAAERNSLLGTSVLSLFDPSEHHRLKSYNRVRMLSGSGPSVYEVRGKRKSGDQAWLEVHVRATHWDGKDSLYITITDISERKRQQELIIRQANFDILTGLPNRNLFLDRLNQAVSRSHGGYEQSALLFVDLDRFKNINDTQGHSVGDMLITASAVRISEELEEGETVARLSGDEFAIILIDVEDEWGIEARASRILSKINQPVTIGAGADISTTASIGISLSPGDGVDGEGLLQQSETAMFQAKANGGNSIRFFSQPMNDKITRTTELEYALRAAIEKRELDLYFQPVVDTSTGSVISCEALARWTDRELGFVSPAEFIPIAEDTGQIIPLGNWVLEEACRFFKTCETRGLNLPSISVNLSARQCHDASLIDIIRYTLDVTKMDPNKLHLEITESILFDDHQIDAAQVLNAIRGLGIHLSLDDFGTGYSSLSYLKRLPVDTLKVDRSFISGLEEDRDGQALVKAIISLADSLGMRVICEGAETEQQCNILAEMGCQLIQGFYFAKPMPSDEFMAFLETRSAEARKRVQAG